MKKLMVGVLTGFKFENRRQRCCATWICDIEKYHNIDWVFLFGVPQKKSAERIGHCLFLPAPDNYQHLCIRTREMCRWAVTQRDWDYFAKIDDDCRLSVPRLVELVDGLTDEQYIGYPIIERARADGSVCGHDTARLNIDANCPCYASGNGYIFGRQAAECLAENLCPSDFDDTPEDMAVGRIMRKFKIKTRWERQRFHVLARPGEQPGPENHWVYASPCDRSDQ